MVGQGAVALAAVAPAAVAAELTLLKTPRAVAARPLMFVVGGTCSRSLSPPGQPLTGQANGRNGRGASTGSAKNDQGGDQGRAVSLLRSTRSDRGLIVACTVQDRYLEVSCLAGTAREQR